MICDYGRKGRAFSPEGKTTLANTLPFYHFFSQGIGRPFTGAGSVQLKMGTNIARNLKMVLAVFMAICSVVSLIVRKEFAPVSFTGVAFGNYIA